MPSPTHLTAIEVLPFAVVVFGPGGAVTMANPAAERLLGPNAEVVRGQVRQALQGRATTAEIRRETDGGDLELRVTATPLREPSGAAAGAVVTAEDVTESKLAERALVRVAEKAGLLLEAARYFGETVDPGRVYDRFHELLADSIQHDGVVVSSYDEAERLIRCEYAWVEGRHVDPSTLPVLPLNPDAGMQSKVIVTGQPLLANDVAERVARGGTFYNVDREGTVRKIPESGPAATRAAMMVPIKLEGRVVGVVQLMSDREAYTSEQLELVEGLVAQMAAAVRNARLYAERRRMEAAEAAARAAAAEREQAATVLEAVGDGVFLVDAEDVVRFWNHAAELVTGRPAAAARGRPVSEVLPHWQAIADQVPIAEGGAVARSVTLPLDLGGGEQWLSFVAVRSSDGVVYAFRDLTSERRLEEAKSDFIATVSHELRTPMAGVYGAAQTLLRRDVEFTPDQTRDLVGVIATQAARLSQITEEVLLASRLDRGDLPIERERVDVAELAAEAVDAMRSQLPEGIRLSLEAQPGVSDAFGDRDRLQQVVINLLDNAIKYSPEGGTVTLSLEPADRAVRLSVVDSGLGIPAAEQDRVFEKFYRVDPHLRRAAGGTGLGLYISRELVRRMGGHIGVRSEPGVGSTFFVELPAAG